jgi:hypothetical protein
MRRILLSLAVVLMLGLAFAQTAEARCCRRVRCCYTPCAPVCQPAQPQTCSYVVCCRRGLFRRCCYVVRCAPACPAPAAAAPATK